MPTTHIVQQGENLTVIARKYGIPDWRTIYNHPNNLAFRSKRPNPNLIFPGDQFFIPNATPGLASPPSKVEFHLSVRDAISKSGFPHLTLKLKLPHGAVKEFKTDLQGTIQLKEPEVIAGKVDILEIADKNAQPWISYSSFVQKGLATDTTNVLDIPNKRKLIDDVAAKHGIVRRSAWGKKTPNYLSFPSRRPNHRYCAALPACFGKPSGIGRIATRRRPDSAPG